ncbi:hypothetical protein KUTeg_002817 [Tegillarca granosa]|uniref:Uncharacterized protein n=1 Tax=Tegillarca granosa TaxID=220873 RepID=A0ABQ9FSH5_TEGGR|nr:hypothetical protein KUTeg_002817 [Tegillarca granosa]
MNIATVPSNDEYLKSNAKDYEKLLFIDGQNIPDPLKLSSNWLNEKEVMLGQTCNHVAGLLFRLESAGFRISY